MEDCISTNTQKADRVRAFVAEYTERYECQGEDHETILTDIIADFGHYYDALPEDERQEGVDWFSTILENALWHYGEEVEDERIHP